MSQQVLPAMLAGSGTVGAGSCIHRSSGARLLLDPGDAEHLIWLQTCPAVR